MNYEIVNLEKKIIVGLSATTGNRDPNMGAVIGGLWSKFYSEGIAMSLSNPVNKYAIGLYSDYTNDGYTVTVGKEVSNAENYDLSVKIIPAGKYAKFSIHGHMVNSVAVAWNSIWKMDLDRSFTGDFEEYLNCEVDEADINIYVSLN